MQGCINGSRGIEMSKHYKFEVPFSGYCRGYTVLEVIADNIEEARAEVGEGIGEEISHTIVRDDREYEWGEATLLP